MRELNQRDKCTRSADTQLHVSRGEESKRHNSRFLRVCLPEPGANTAEFRLGDAHIRQKHITGVFLYAFLCEIADIHRSVTLSSEHCDHTQHD